jgi:hypothetical protein
VTRNRWRDRLGDREVATYLLRFVVFELPVIAAGVLFWLGLALKLGHLSIGWLLALLAALVLTLAGAFLLLRDRWHHLRRGLLQHRVSEAMQSSPSKPATRVKDWIQAVPSANDIRAIESLCTNVASEWASDGTVVDITYYIENFGSSVRLGVQAKAHSAIRSEYCHLNVGNSRAAPGLVETAGDSTEMLRSLLLIPSWRDAWLTAIEAAAEAIDACVRATMMVKVFSDSVHLSTWGQSGARHYDIASTLRRDGRLVEDRSGRLIRVFEVWPDEGGAHTRRRDEVNSETE